MPRMPKWLADFSEKTFKAAYKQTVITEVEYYAPKLKRIRYQGDALRSIEWKPAQEVEFRVTDTEYRHYTPMYWNKEKGYTDVLFYLHGKGPGSSWASDLKVNDELLLIGPGGKFIIPDNSSRIVMMGDETTLSTFYGMQQQLPGGVTNIHCLIECEAEAMGWPEKIGMKAIPLQTIPSFPGRIQEEWLRQHLNTADSATAYFLSGNADTMKNLRRLLVSTGVPGAQIRMKPYWLKGKKGL
jgi:NADPH-dependent ferric siderophore reductase